jgi:hypothetical protein
MPTIALLKVIGEHVKYLRLLVIPPTSNALISERSILTESKRNGKLKRRINLLHAAYWFPTISSHLAQSRQFPVLMARTHPLHVCFY